MTSLLAPAGIGLDPPTPGQLRRARLGVVVTFAVAGLLFASWVPRIPEMKARLDLSAGSLGVALLAPSIGALVAMSFAGGLSARLGTARATRLFTLVFCVFGWLPGLAGSLPALWIYLFLWGAGIGGMDVAMNAQAVSVEKAYHRPLMSGFHAAWSLGSLLGAVVGTIGASGKIPIATQQLAVSAALLVVALAVSTTFLADPRPDPVVAGRDREGLGGGRAGPPPSRRWRGWVRRGPLADLDGRLVLLGLAGMAAMLSEGSVADWTGILLRDSLHAPAGHVGLAFAAFMTTETTGRLIGDRVLLYLGRVPAVIVVTVIGSVGLAVGMATGTVLGTVIGFALLGVGLSIIVPVVFSAAADGRASAGPALAAVSSLSYLGFLAGPTTIGFVAQLSSIPAALWLIPVISAAGGVLAVVGLRRSNGTTQTPPHTVR